jgi:mRNA interferase MazF
VYVVSFDPVVGSEIAKTRPALIIQNDIGNRVSPITIVAAFSSQARQPLYPFEVLVRAPEGGSPSTQLSVSIRFALSTSPGSASALGK